MDFLKSTLASAISKGPPFPYSFGDRVDVENTSVWALYNGTKREDGSNCSIFSFEINDSTKSRLPLAKNAARKLRTLRHPGVVKVLDSVETDSYIYIATERVTPLAWHVRRGSLKTETMKWGLWSVAITLKFINDEASSIHGNVRTSSVFTSESGEWKLAGFEVLSSMKDDDPVIYRYGSLVPDSGRYAAPEVVKGGWDTLKNQPLHVTDAWNFGTLIYEVFNDGSFSNSEQLSSPKKIPPNMAAAYKRLITANPKMRLSVGHFLEQGLRQRGFFDIPLIHISEFVENMGVKDQAEREEFLEELGRTGDQFPEDFFKMKILPELLKSVEFGGGGPKVFSVVLKIGEALSDEEWETSLTPAVVRLFSLPDRATRVFLLDNLPKMADHLSKKVINDKIFPEMLTGFSDVAPIVREQTVKAVLTVVPKLSERNVNGDLLKNLAKTQNDAEPGIRTNTTICLGKIAKNLGQNTRTKVLTAAFSRSLRDPFVHARNASLLALSATVDLFDENDCASRLIPAIAPSLVDKEKVIRAQAQKTLDAYLARIKTLTSSYPDSVLPAPGSEATNGSGAPRMGSAAMNDKGWAGWAISSFTSKVSAATGTIERAKSPEERSVSAPTPSAFAPPPRPTMESISGRTPSSSVATVSAPKAPAGFLDDADNEDNDPDGWGDMEEDNFFDAPAEKKLEKPAPPPATRSFGSVKPFEISGEEEVDFEALVSGGKPKRPLPGGLTRKSGTSSTRSLPTMTKKPTTPAPRKTTPSAPKKVEPKKPEPKNDPWDDNGDGWGDSWDG